MKKQNSKPAKSAVKGASNMLQAYTGMGAAAAKGKKKGKK
jgi:hypothetical protein